MDNNPFRSQHQTSAGNSFGQPQQQQPQQQAPYQTMSYTGYTGYQQPQTTQQQYQSPLQQQQQQQPQAQQWNSYQGLDSSNSMYTPTSTFNNAYNTSSFPQQNNPSFSTAASVGPATPYSPYSSTTTNTLQGYNTSTSTSNTLPMTQGYNTNGSTPTMNQGYNQGMPNPLNYTNTNNAMGYQNQYGQQQPNNPSNFYIPPNWGMSTTNNNNNNNMFQPKHAPVDATSFLKGTEIRRVECPVCQKMLEGDDMAINHHVNEHYT